MKTKEIRERIQSMGFERGAVYVLEALNEQHIQTRRDLAELAAYFDKLVDSMNGVVVVAERMKEHIDKNRMKEEDLGPNTYSLGEDE